MVARWCVGVGLAGLTIPALAQQAPAVQELNGVTKAAHDPAWLEPIIQRLDSDDLAVRDRASTDLRTDPRLSLDQLQARIADHSRPLTPEQQLRMNQIAVALFRETPRAALGVSFARIVPGGVELGLVIAQFDARRVLRAGDIVAEMDGVPIVSPDDARAVIISHDPGDEMRVTFTRGGEAQTATVKLGSYRELQNGSSLNDSILREAWLLRCERVQGQGQPQAAPIDAGLTQPQWAQAKAAENAALTRRMRQEVDPRQPPDLSDVDVLVGGGVLRRVEGIPLQDFTAGGQRRGRSPESARLQAEIENYQAQLRNIDAKLARDLTLNEAQRRAFMQSSLQLREQIIRKRAEQRRLTQEEALRGR
jgi:hypothetical protein